MGSDDDDDHDQDDHDDTIQECRRIPSTLTVFYLNVSIVTHHDDDDDDDADDNDNGGDDDVKDENDDDDKEEGDDGHDNDHDDHDDHNDHDDHDGVTTMDEDRCYTYHNNGEDDPHSTRPALHEPMSPGPSQRINATRNGPHLSTA